MTKRLLPIYFCILSSQCLWAQEYASAQNTLSHLISINAEWVYHAEKAPKELVKFKSDNDRIQLHLKLVTMALKQAEPTGLSSMQRQNRTELLDTLEAYALRKVFPVNSYHTVRRPYFIDIHSTYCAVGYLIKASGNQQLALNIHEQYNYDYIKNIQTEGLGDWAIEHGFGIDELAWIQPTYGGNEQPIRINDPPVGRVHGTINQKYHYQYKGTRGGLAFGNFDTVWNQDGSWQISNGLAYFSEGTWQCIGNELQGSVKRIHYTGIGAIIVEGTFIYEGSTHSCALLDPKLGWQFPLGNNDPVFPPKNFSHTRQGKLQYFGYYRELGNGTYIMAVEGSGKIHLVAFLAGYVHSLSVEANHSSQYSAAHNLCIAGSFDSLSFTAYRIGTGVSWMKSKNLVVAQLADPIKVSQKKEPHMYLVDTAFEYKALLFKKMAHGTIAQSILKNGTVYNVATCTDSAKTPTCLSAYRISQPLKPVLSKRTHASTKRPFRFNDEVYYDGKRLRIKD